jgi:hypothetical protein
MTIGGAMIVIIVDDDVVGCNVDFTADPTTDEEIPPLLDPGSRDRTEDEEGRRRAI